MGGSVAICIQTAHFKLSPHSIGPIGKQALQSGREAVEDDYPKWDVAQVMNGTRQQLI